MPDATHDAIHDAKRAWRAELRERRAQFSPAQRDEAARGLEQNLLALVRGTGAASVSCYLSGATEPDTRRFLRAARGEGIRVLLPLTRVDGLLDWVEAREGAGEIEGPHGVPEPTGDVLGPIAVGDVDLMIVPAAAVARDGVRLGWGRGFFDRTLGSMADRPPVYAVVFDDEVVDTLPRDLHDQPVDGVVTPHRVLPFPA